MKHNPFLRSTPNKKRKEHRRVRDRERLYGVGKSKRRQEIFERSGGQCEACVVCGRSESDQSHKFWEPPGGHQFQRCTVPISPMTAHWSHNRHAARKDDAFAGGIASCLGCHARSHNAGGKPVPRRLGRLMRRNEAIPYLKSQQCVCGRAKKQDSPFCEGCQSVISPQSKLNLETLIGREWLKAMQDAEQEVLAAIAEGRYS